MIDPPRWLGRRWLSIAATVAASALLAACGGTPSDLPPAPAAPAAPPSASPAFPVSIEHKFGSTTIPAEPERVVTVGWNDQDFVLALGVVPVSTRSWFEDYSSYPWVSSALKGQPLPTFSEEIDLEAIAQQKPDLVLAIYETIDQATYDKLSKIAPTVVQSQEYPDEETPWDAQTLLTGTALGKPDEAQKLVDTVKSKIDAARSAHPEFAGKTLVADFGPENGGHYLLPAGDPRRAVFDALGFGAQQDQAEISEERVDLLDRDVLFVNGASKESMLASPTFARLKVVQDDRTLYTTFETPLAGALAYSGPNALAYALDVLVPQLAAATDNNPATPVADLSKAG
ncbi:MAG: ABC transporter substrate-binding protein [Pseudonocardia sp.]|nr:ABC transporter substrate-binding protein [Pseudonocardia sp.]